MAETVDSKRIKEMEDTKQVLSQKLDTLTEMIRQSSYTVFYTGAGVSTSCGVGDYRGPDGAWTQRKINQLVDKKRNNALTAKEHIELSELLEELEKKKKQRTKKVDMMDAEPSPSHMAQATLIRRGLAHYVITTNLDGIYRKTGLIGNDQVCFLHGDVYMERCTGCGYDFERNFHTRQSGVHVHDHKLGTCSKCGSAPLESYSGYPYPENKKMKGSTWGGCMVGTRDKNMGTKDTHINFGEYLDEVDWRRADTHSRKADLCIVAGTSMSLRHITHFPFQAKQTVIINLQQTPDDEFMEDDDGRPDRSKPCHLRIWAKCDDVFMGILDRLGIENDPIPAWTPRDSLPICDIPKYVHPYYVQKAKKLMARAQERKEELRILRGDSASSSSSSSSSSTGPEKHPINQKKSTLATRRTKPTEATRQGIFASLLGRKEKKTLKPTTTRIRDRYGNISFEGVVQLEVGNTCRLVDTKEGQAENRFDWTMFVRAGSSTQNSIEQIKFVEYHLHPSFQPSIVRIACKPFQIRRCGWGTFEVKVVITWNDNTGRAPTTLRHVLNFEAPETSKAIRIQS